MLVQRSFDVVEATSEEQTTAGTSRSGVSDGDKSVLVTTYRATTNRMLRVAVNGFFDSLGTVVQVMEELDADVVHEKGLQGLEGVQGVEQGMTGTTLTGG